MPAWCILSRAVHVLGSSVVLSSGTQASVLQMIYISAPELDC